MIVFLEAASSDKEDSFIKGCLKQIGYHLKNTLRQKKMSYQGNNHRDESFKSIGIGKEEDARLLTEEVMSQQLFPR